MGIYIYMVDGEYRDKYLKYKSKYCILKYGGGNSQVSKYADVVKEWGKDGKVLPPDIHNNVSTIYEDTNYRFRFRNIKQIDGFNKKCLPANDVIENKFYLGCKTSWMGMGMSYKKNGYGILIDARYRPLLRYYEGEFVSDQKYGYCFEWDTGPKTSIIIKFGSYTADKYDTNKYYF